MSHPNVIQIPYTLEEIMQVLAQHAYDNCEIVFPPGVNLNTNVLMFGEPQGGMPEKQLDEKAAEHRASYNRVKHLLRPSATTKTDDVMDKALVSGGAMVTFSVAREEPASNG